MVPMKFFKLSICILCVSVLFNSCKKEYSSEHLLDPIGSWQFREGSLYSGYLDNFHTSTGVGSNVQLLTGKTFDNTASLELKLFTDSLKAGTFRASQFQCSLLYSSGGKTIYEANGQIGEFIVNITTIDSTHLTGSFSGTAEDKSGNLVQISEGEFIIQ
jgi:hypothetical protein